MCSPFNATVNCAQLYQIGRPIQQYDYPSESSSPFSDNRLPVVQIVEQPASIGARFRYKCEGRSAGCIRGVSSTEKDKTFPAIKINGYQGIAGVVVSCITKDGPPYYPHPHNLVGRSCANGVCYKSIEDAEAICNFPNLGIQCVKRKDVKDSLLNRKELQIDPFGTGFSHIKEPSKINLNALRLCFQVFIPDSNGKLTVPLHPVISCPIFDNKTVSDLTIIRLSHYCAPVTGGQEIILLCNQVNKDDIQILFYEESGPNIIWSAQGLFSPHHVHRKAAITFRTPVYRDCELQGRNVECFVQLRRPSDGAVGKARPFTLFPLVKDPEGIARKRSKFESLGLDKLIQPSNVMHNPEASNISPRVIKHAVRSKTNPSSGHSGYVSQPTQLLHQASDQDHRCPNYSKASTSNTNDDNMHFKQNEPNVNSPANVQRYIVSPSRSDSLAIAAEQMSESSSHAPCEIPCDETFDKLSSLDLGLDSDIVDLSNILLDSFSESSVPNNSAHCIDVRNPA